MPDHLSIATWNINSVRLRIDLVTRFLAEYGPDVLCLQETKCPNDVFPTAAFDKIGYRHKAYIGIKGYNGVAILSKRPLTPLEPRAMCGRDDARHIAARIGEGSKAVTLHNFYVPAGGDVADPEQNPKFAHKLAFVEELKQVSDALRSMDGRTVIVGDFNVAPLEHDVWSHKQLLDVVSHTPVETEGLTEVLQAGDWHDVVRAQWPEPQKVYSWWSYRSPDWDKADKGRRLDHVWVGRGLKDGKSEVSIIREARGWERPSDHVPVMARIEID
jgi:exodeoxyribonuclease-3